MKLNARTIFSGKTMGEAIVSQMGISFFGGVDPDTGTIVERDHDLFGVNINNKILVFPSGKGSTVGSYTLYRLKHNGLAPLAIINAICETITAVGCIIAEIPCMDNVDISSITTGDYISIDGEKGTLEIFRKQS